MKFPKDQLPAEYNRELMTRQMEDIYATLGQFEDVDGQISSLIEEMESMKNEVTQLSNAAANNKILEETVLPTPENLEIVKWKALPIVFVRCKHLEILKYPYVRGFQFFISQEHDFIPRTDSAEFTLSGTHSGVSGATLSHTADLTASSYPAFGGGTAYVNIPFWAEMELVGSKVINITDNSTGAVTAWSKVTPWQMTTTLVGGSDNQWDNGDTYNIKITGMRSNLMHQGPLPFAVYILRPKQTWPANTKWDSVSYYVKARTYGIGGPRSGRFSDYVCASTTTVDDYDLDGSNYNPTINNTDDTYGNDINWTPDGNIEDTLSHYRVYRTTANDSNLITTDTYLVADNVTEPRYVDSGYDATTNPNGAQPCITYYYWIRPVDINGNIGDNSTSVTGHILIAADPNIYSGVEEEDRGWARTKSWVVKWTCAGSAMGYFVRYRFKLNGTYGIWTTPVYIPHTTEFGQSGGEDIQSYTFHHLRAGRTYTFAVKATWNPMISGVASNWVTQDYTINNTSVPAAPT